MSVLSSAYRYGDNKLVGFLDNPIVQNALQNTYERGDESLIFVSKYDLQEVSHLIHPRFKGNMVRLIQESVVFWIADSKICFS